MTEQRCNIPSSAVINSISRQTLAAESSGDELKQYHQPSTVDNVNELRTLWRGLDACLRYDEDEDDDAGLSKVSFCLLFMFVAIFFNLVLFFEGGREKQPIDYTSITMEYYVRLMYGDFIYT